MKSKLIFLIPLLFSTSSLANVFYCPNNHQYIQIGDTQAQVQAACGNPSHTTSRTRRDTQPVVVQTWIFNHDIYLQRELRKPEFGIQLKNNIVSGITVSGHVVSGTTLCDNVHSIKIGDPIAKVSALCGEPFHISHSEEPEVKGVKSVVIWRYDFGPYQKPATLEFEDGLLIAIDD